VALGDELADFLDNNVDSLAFICANSVQVLTGSTVLGSNPDLQTDETHRSSRRLRLQRAEGGQGDLSRQ
jgi:hypothetical protein